MESRSQEPEWAGVWDPLPGHEGSSPSLSPAAPTPAALGKAGASSAPTCTKVFPQITTFLCPSCGFLMLKTFHWENISGKKAAHTLFVYYVYLF